MTLPPVLLTMGSYYGTLAAARSLGRIGVPVTLADNDVLATSKWSRFVERRMRCPRIEDAQQFMDFLIDFGRNNERHVLLPTSDDVAWLMSSQREELSRYYYLYQPTLHAIDSLLNKRRLFDLCQEVGLDTPKSWFPKSKQDLIQVAREARFPVLLKPVTQVLNQSGSKGVEVARPEDLEAALELFNQSGAHSMPIVQELHSEAETSIYNISGFIEESGRRFVMRAGVKVLQQPRRLGIGLCFESAPVRPHLADRILELCRRVGFHGVFEAEFLQVDGRELMIDFNPRFYHQLSFDIARGLCSAELLYHGARGADADLDRCLEGAWQDGHKAGAHSNLFVLSVLLCAQRISGALSKEEANGWLEWYRGNREHCSDAVLDGADPAPAIFDVASTLYKYARHPRGFLNGMVLNR